MPIDETLTLLRHNLMNKGSLEILKVNQMMMILKTILHQTYFSFENAYYKQNEGLAMGSSLSGILADLYLCLLYTSVNLIVFFLIEKENSHKHSKL